MQISLGRRPSSKTGTPVLMGLGFLIGVAIQFYTFGILFCARTKFPVQGLLPLIAAICAAAGLTLIRPDKWIHVAASLAFPTLFMFGCGQLMSNDPTAGAWHWAVMSLIAICATGVPSWITSRVLKAARGKRISMKH